MMYFILFSLDCFEILIFNCINNCYSMGTIREVYLTVHVEQITKQTILTTDTVALLNLFLPQRKS